MKLMIREHMPLICLYSFQTVLVPMIYWLDGYQNLWLSLYVIVLSYVFLIAYLGYRFFRHARLYTILSTADSLSLSESLSDEETAPLMVAFNQRMSYLFRSFQRDLHQYKERLDRQITFINLWVHQMKTPLSVIDLILQTVDHPESKQIRLELDRIRKGLEMVLYTARLDYFEQDFYVEKIDLQRVVKRVITENKSTFIYRQIYPVISVKEEMRVYTDEKWIAFVFSQLLTNAVKYTDPGGKVAITIDYQRGEGIFEVRDHGIGIPKQDLQRVFEPYFTGQQGRDYSESTGMGLYLVKEICKRLNHQVELESEEGKGTVVRIRFANVEHVNLPNCKRDES